MRLCFFLFFFFAGLQVFSQEDTLLVQKSKDSVSIKTQTKYYYRDSAAMAKAMFLRDSLTKIYLKPDANRPNLFVDSLLRKYIITDKTLLSHSPNIKVTKSSYGSGNPIKKNPFWIIGVILFLLVAFGSLRVIFKKQLSLMFEAFYDNRVLAQINKDDHVFVSWHFLFSYLIFSFTIGLFLYIIFNKIPLTFSISGPSLYLIISVLFAVFLGLKIVCLKFIGYLFLIQKVVNEYINVIYLSCFNISIIFIPLTFILVLISYKDTNTIITVGAVVLSLIFLLQFFRAGVQILRNYRLSKFYLILYLCTLEICPVLIIIKALNIY